ncbi:MAG TPA: hypothetical protein VM165_09145, partial [Planctomycetaceae bacterium]|nr:hypothetical protein [Planctomycetaceae bacterium]
MSRASYAIALVLLSWLLMQAVHEWGHVVGAWAAGGTVQRVVLHPLTISRTDVVDDARPLVTIWCGPILGAMLPLLVCLAGRCRWPLDQALRFFAGFCLIANGSYLAYGSFDGIGDAGELLEHGSPIWTLWLFGAITIPAGFGIWHRLGHRLGLGPATP